MVFYLEVLKCGLVFLYQGYHLNYQKCFHIYEMYLRALIVRNVLYKKEVEI